VAAVDTAHGDVGDGHVVGVARDYARPVDGAVVGQIEDLALDGDGWEAGAVAVLYLLSQ
jgi:hypothetical protein